MTPRRVQVGTGGHPLVIVDGASGDAAGIAAIAERLGQFPPARSGYYPGLRRVVTDDDADAFAYVTRLLEALAPFIGGAFDLDGFDLVEASFSMVTTPPSALSGPQRAPHFDAVDPHYLAILHYLTETEGTAFFRQRATGIEAVTAETRAAFIADARRAEPRLAGYIAGSTADYEEIGRVEGRLDRVAIYPGRLLHSGVIRPPAAPAAALPRRLTANLFVQGWRR